MKFRDSTDDVVLVQREADPQYMGTLEPWDGEYRYVHSPERGSVKSLNRADLEAILVKVGELNNG